MMCQTIVSRERCSNVQCPPPTAPGPLIITATKQLSSKQIISLKKSPSIWHNILLVFVWRQVFVSLVMVVFFIRGLWSGLICLIIIIIMAIYSSHFFWELCPQGVRDKLLHRVLIRYGGTPRVVSVPFGLAEVPMDPHHYSQRDFTCQRVSGWKQANEGTS